MLCDNLHAQFLAQTWFITMLLSLHTGGSGFRLYDGPDLKLFLFSFWSFEVSEGILRNQKLIIGLDSFYN